MPCRAITLYLFLGLAREVQGHRASQGPEPLAVQRLYFNVYLLQRETAFGFEPLMRKKIYRAQEHCVPRVSLGQGLGRYMTLITDKQRKQKIYTVIERKAGDWHD